MKYEIMGTTPYMSVRVELQPGEALHLMKGDKILASTNIRLDVEKVDTGKWSTVRDIFQSSTGMFAIYSVPEDSETPGVVVFAPTEGKEGDIYPVELDGTKPLVINGDYVAGFIGDIKFTASSAVKKDFMSTMLSGDSDMATNILTGTGVVFLTHKRAIRSFDSATTGGEVDLDIGHRIGYLGTIDEADVVKVGADSTMKALRVGENRVVRLKGDYTLFFYV